MAILKVSLAKADVARGVVARRGSGKCIRATLLASALYLPASAIYAQNSETINPTPPQRVIDANGVDMTTGVVSFNKVLITGGDPARPLTIAMNVSTNPSSALMPAKQLNVGFAASYFPSFEYPTFSSIGGPLGNYVFRSQSGPSWSLGPGPRALTSADTQLVTTNGDQVVSSNNSVSVRYADGEVWNYIYGTLNVDGTSYYVLKFIVSSRGYGIQFDSVKSSYFSGTFGATFTDFSRMTFYNKAYVYCDETQAVDCPAVSALNTTATINYTPYVSGAGAGNPTFLSRSTGPGAYDTPRTYRTLTSMTMATPGEQGVTIAFGLGDDLNQNSYYVGHAFADVLKIEKAGVAGSTRTFQYVHAQGTRYVPDTSGLYKVSDGTSIWTYKVPSPSGIYDTDPTSIKSASATDPAGNAYGASAINWFGAITTKTDELNRSWTAVYDNVNFRLTSMTNPEGGRITYAYDSRGNPTEERRIAKSGSGLADIVRTAGYPATCGSYLTCNKPSWIRDARGQQTDFSYNANNGAVETMTEPADANGVRPQKRYAYVQRYAWVMNGGGGYAPSGSPIWVLASESRCRNSAATGNPAAPCAGNDEIRTTYDYGPDGVPNNLFLRGETVTADGVSLRTCYGNDLNGRRISTTKPRANLASCS